ncbi:MAG: DUF1080 domain-containing protein [Planctomycetota bacterium]
MKNVALLVVLMSLSALFIRAEEPATEPIFNGKDLTGWKVPEPNPWWTVADGILIGTSDEKKKGHVLETEKAYQDCIIEAKARWTGSIDSGIFVRKGQKWQCQIGVSRSLKVDMTCSIYAAGSYKVKAKGVDKLLKEGDWNAIKIEAKGDHYKIWLNGEIVVDEDLKGFNEPGPIGLQIHPGVQMKVEFKDFKAVELKK